MVNYIKKKLNEGDLIIQKPKTIFITGATGFVGSNLAYKFLREGYKVKLLVRSKKGSSAQERIDNILIELCNNNLNQIKEIKKNIEIVEGDITQSNYLGISKKQLEDFRTDVGAVFHCAALMSFDVKKKEELFKQNVEGTRNVLELVVKLNIPFFHYLSTAYVCGQKISGKVSEETLNRPEIFNNPYEETKFEAEELVRKYKDKYRMKANIYRPSIIVGDSNRGMTPSLYGYYTVIRAMYILRERIIKHLKKEDPRLKSLNVRFNGEKLYLPLRVGWLKDRPLNLVPIDYVVDVILEIFKDPDLFNKTFFIIHPKPPTVEEVLKYTCKVLNISTFQIVNHEEFIKKPKTFIERFFLQQVKEYSPYLEIPEPQFENFNVPQAIRGSIKAPIINYSFISKLVNYCIQTNWRRASRLNN